MKRKKISKAKSNELNKMKEDLDNVKGELGEIKGLYSNYFVCPSLRPYFVVTRLL